MVEKYIYKNISDENRIFRHGGGGKDVVAPGEIFESYMKNDSQWFELVDESAFSSAGEEEEPKKKSKKGDKYE